MTASPADLSPVLIPAGPEYLAMATTLLQRMRRAAPDSGAWEAADLQWWWRQPRPTDAAGQLFWLDSQSQPVAAVVLTQFGASIQCDVLILAGEDAFRHAVWQQAVGRGTRLGANRAEFTVSPADAPQAAGPLAAAGFAPSADTVVACWLDAARTPAIPRLPPGYRLVSRAGLPDSPHPLAARNGADVGRRLRACSLYRPELDLTVLAPDGSTAGYGLFWPDAVTGIGLVEPMRTEQPHQGRGIASHILATGLHGLAAAGCARLKVSNDLGLYLRAGFRPLPAAAATLYTTAGTG